MTIPKALLHVFLISTAVFAQSLGAAPIPAAPQIAGSGHLLVDMGSGKILSESNADTRLEPASLTKIMTAYVVFKEIQEGSLSLKDQVLVSEKAWKTPGSRMFIEVNKRVTVDDLLKGMIIQSGNDACVALAEHVAGSEETFANLMNEHARRLGMNNTHFVNSTGLPDPEHYTTARDITQVTMATIREFPEFYKLYSVKEFTFNKITQQNRNQLLWRDDTVDGVKTGHTEAAGYCLVASAMRENMRLVSVVMGTSSNSSRSSETQSLLNYGFRFYETHKLYAAGDELTRTKVWKASTEQVGLGLQKDLFITIPRKKYDLLTARTVINPTIEAPVSKGQQLGHVIVELEGEVLAKAPLIALQAVTEGGIMDVAIDSVLLMFE